MWVVGAGVEPVVCEVATVCEVCPEVAWEAVVWVAVWVAEAAVTGAGVELALV